MKIIDYGGSGRHEEYFVDALLDVVGPIGLWGFP